MRELFAERARPLYSQALPVRLGRIDPSVLAEHIGRKFAATGKERRYRSGSVRRRRGRAPPAHDPARLAPGGANHARRARRRGHREAGDR